MILFRMDKSTFQIVRGLHRAMDLGGTAPSHGERLKFWPVSPRPFL
jgi:hypothetical protein